MFEGCIPRTNTGRYLSVRRHEPADAERVRTVHELALRPSPLPFVEDTPADDDLRTVSKRSIDVGGEFPVGIADDKIVAIGEFQPRGDD